MNIERFAALIRLLASDKDAEVLAAVRAIKKLLAASKKDLNDFAKWIEDTKMQARISRGHTVVIYTSRKQAQKDAYENGKRSRA